MIHHENDTGDPLEPDFLRRMQRTKTIVFSLMGAAAVLLIVFLAFSSHGRL